MAEVLDLYITFVLNLLVTICTIALMLSTNLKKTQKSKWVHKKQVQSAVKFCVL